MTKQGELFNRSLTTSPSFHNTVKVEGEELLCRQYKAENQDKTVLNFFIMTPPYEFTASEVIEAMAKEGIKMKESSIRRALSNLSFSRTPEQAPFLRKSDNKKISTFGAPEHYYQLIKP